MIKGMFYIVNRETEEGIGMTPFLESAKRLARKQGHTGEVVGKWYLPVVGVDKPLEDGSGYEVVYNPKFKV